MTDGHDQDIRDYLIERLDKRQKASSRFKEMTDRVVEDMLRTGWKFAKTDDDTGYARAPGEKAWTPVHERSEGLERTLFRVYGHAMNGSTQFAKYFVKHLKAWVGDPDNGHAPRRTFHRIAYFDRDQLAIYVSNRDGKAFRITETEVEVGEHPDVLFLDSRRHSKGKPLTIDTTVEGDALRGVLFDALRFSGDERSVLTADEQRATFELWLVSLFFGDVQLERPILVIIGPHGSGKSTALRLTGHVLAGPGFHLVDQHENQDDFNVAAMHTRLLFVDNAESAPKWMRTKLSTLATGSEVSKRQLWTGSDEEVLRFDVNLALCAIDPTGVTAPDLASRLLVLSLDSPVEKSAASSLTRSVETKVPQVWGGIVDRLQRILGEMRRRPDWQDVPTGAFRIADFEAFARVAAPALEIESRYGVDIDTLVAKWTRAQTAFVVEHHPVHDLLESYLAAGNSVDGQTAAELQRELLTFGSERRLLIDDPQLSDALKNGRRLERAIRPLKDRADGRFACMSRTGHGGAERYFITRRSGRVVEDDVERHLGSAALACQQSEEKEVVGLVPTLREMARHVQSVAQRRRRERHTATPAEIRKAARAKGGER